jgi:hypothetical protein
VGRKIFYLKFLWEGIKTPSFAQNIGESGLSGVGRNNISQYLLFKIPFRRHQNTQFFTEHWRIWAFRCGQGQYYLNFFYLKLLREGIKTPSFAQKIGESGLSGVGSGQE